VDKPRGPTSFDVVRRVRQALRIKRIGHTGTLDPLATGVLALCLNRATKMVPFLQAGRKIYTGDMILGMSTETDDITGRVTAKRADFDLSPREIIDAAREFVGAIEQVPPAYSAVKLGGVPAYRRARAGEKIALKSRIVQVDEFEITGIDMPRVSFHLRVSSGTYVRSIVADLGRRLKTGACLETLRRLSSSPFSLKDAVTLDEALDLARAERIEERIIPLEQALAFMPAVQVQDRLVRSVENGQVLPLSCLEDYHPQPGPVRVLTRETGLLAIYQYTPSEGPREQDQLTPLRILGRNA